MDSMDQPGFGIKSFEAILNEAAEQQPARVAFTLLENDHNDNELITYKQLKNQVDFVASILYSRFNVGDRVVLFYPTSIEFTVALLGCLAAGVVAVPVHTPMGLTPTDREKWVARIVDESEAKAVLTTEVLFRLMKERFPEIDIIDPGNVPPESMPAGFSPAANSEAMLIYSTNQTGEACTTRYSYFELLGKMQALKGRFKHSEDSIIVSCIATTSEMGVLGHVLQAIYCKCTAAFMSPTMAYRKPVRWLLAISDYSATTASAPQEVIELCNQLEQIHEPIPQLGTLNTCYSEPGVVGTEAAETFTQKFSQYGLPSDVIKPFELRAPKGNLKMNFATPNDLNSRLFADV